MITDALRNVLTCLEVMREATAREILERHPGATPTEWVAVVRLRRAFGITQRQINRLVALGVLEMRPSDGSGPEVRRANP